MFNKKCFSEQRKKIRRTEKLRKRLLACVDVKNPKNWTDELLGIAYACCFGSGKRMVDGHAKICGCIDCETIFKVSEIKEWADDAYPTPVCPYCWDDMVLDDTSGFPITEEFLRFLHQELIGDEDNV